MTTVTKENYLKALHYLHQKNIDISLTELGKKMGVSKPTVNDMVKKLQANGWVNYERYKPIKLTNEGKKTAAFIVRKHRLSEMFLVKIMGFGWEQVHDIAEELEHTKSDILFDRMDELLGFPTVDPHGSPIPDKEGNFFKQNYKLLSQVTEKSKVIVKGLRDSSTDLLLLLNKKELVLGTEVYIQYVESFDKTVTISYAGHTDVSLSDSVSSRLFVEVI
jgi:DtxR family transcriptional regulator, Mn-dependent transcriptional regulator